MIKTIELDRYKDDLTENLSWAHFVVARFSGDVVSAAYCCETKLETYTCERLLVEEAEAKGFVRRKDFVISISSRERVQSANAS